MQIEKENTNQVGVQPPAPQKDFGFFDFETLQNTKNLWIKPDRTLTAKINANKQFEASLQKLGRRSKSWITRHYIISGEYLAYKNVIFRHKKHFCNLYRLSSHRKIPKSKKRCTYLTFDIKQSSLRIPKPGAEQFFVL